MEVRVGRVCGFQRVHLRHFCVPGFTLSFPNRVPPSVVLIVLPSKDVRGCSRWGEGLAAQPGICSIT